MSCRRYLAFALALVCGGSFAAQGDLQPMNPGAVGRSLPPTRGSVAAPAPSSLPPNPGAFPTIPVGSTARSPRVASMAATPTPAIAPWIVGIGAVSGTAIALYNNGDGGNSTSTSTSTSTATATAP